MENKIVDIEEAFVEKVNEKSKTENPLELTFANPYLDLRCTLCDFKTKGDANLNIHISENHTEPESELKFQIYAVVESDFVAMDVRKNVIDNLEKQKEVEKVLSVFVDSRSRLVFDGNNRFLTEANIIIKTKYASNFENRMFRIKIFENCNLRETMPFNNGRMTRAEHLRFRNETGWR